MTPEPLEEAMELLERIVQERGSWLKGTWLKNVKNFGFTALPPGQPALLQSPTTGALRGVVKGENLGRREEVRWLLDFVGRTKPVRIRADGVDYNAVILNLTVTDLIGTGGLCRAQWEAEIVL